MPSSPKISFILSLLACLSFNASKAQADAGYCSYQTSSTMGDHDTYVSNSAVKIVDRSHGNVVVSTAPNWKVYAFNTHTKRICSFSSPRTFTGIGNKLATVTGGVTLYNIPLKQTGKTVLHGISSIELQTPKSFVDKQIKDKEHESADPRFVQSAQMLVAEKVILPVEAAMVLSRFYGVPLQRAMPLQFKYISCRGDLNTILLTSDLKPTKLVAADFEIPKDYKTVTDFTKLEDDQTKKGPPNRKIIETIKKN